MEAENHKRNLTEIKEHEAKINIGEVYFDQGLEGVLEKEEFVAEIQKISREIDEYLGENKNSAVYDFRVYSDRKEYMEYLTNNFPEKSEKDFIDNDTYCIYDEKKNKYFIGKFMTLESNPNDPVVIKYLEENKITFDELNNRNKKNYKNGIYPTIAHELTHSHSFFRGVDYKQSGNKWEQEMISIFIDQKMWERYVPDYKKKTEARAKEQAQGEDLYEEIVKKNDFQIENKNRFFYKDWERFFYQFLENRFGKEKLKDFWSILPECKSEVDFERYFDNIFEERLKDVADLFQKEIMKEKD